MTLLQIQYAVECARCGSITKAAQNLFTSPPNLSKSIRSLEDELGFPIFLRDNNGIHLTAKGNEFLEHAVTVLTEIKSMSGLSAEQKTPHFQLGTIPFDPFYQAFCRLLGEYQDRGKLRFGVRYCGLVSATEEVAHHRIEMATVMISPSQLAFQKSQFHKKGLEFYPIAHFPLAFLLREGHPALDGWKPDELFDFSKLYVYPYVDFDELGLLSLLSQSIFNFNAVNLENIVYVNDRSSKTTLVRTTSFFSLGLKTDVGGSTGIVAIPLPEYEMTIGYLYPKDKELTTFAERFLQLANEELGHTS